MNDGRMTLYPDPAAALRQKPIVLGRRLAFQQYCTTQINRQRHQSRTSGQKIHINNTVFSSLLTVLI